MMFQRLLVTAGIPLLAVSIFLAGCSGGGNDATDASGPAAAKQENIASTTPPAAAVVPSSTPAIDSGLRVLKLTGLDITEEAYRGVLEGALVTPTSFQVLTCRLMPEA